MAAAFDSPARDRLTTAVTAWHSASGLSRDTFRARLLDPYTGDATVDRLRSAARGIVEARTHEALAAAGDDLAAAVQQIGLARWPRYLADAERRAVAAVSGGSVPGIVKVGAADNAVGIGGLVVLGVLGLITSQASRSGRPPKAITQSAPTIVQQNSSEDGRTNEEGATPQAGAGQGSSSPQDEVVISDDRRKHVLDLHGPGRHVAGRSEFPPGWSDDQIIDAIRDAANDPAPAREPGEGGRVLVSGTQDGVDITVVIGRDGKAIATAHPTNTPRNPR